MKQTADWTNEDIQKYASLKKKLFILAGYVLAAALLLIYVTYGQYRITIQATVVTPEAAVFSGNIKLEINESTGIVNSSAYSQFLSGLIPGDRAHFFATEHPNDTNHKMKLEVSNFQEQPVQTQSDEGEQTEPAVTEKLVSEADLRYTIRLYSTGFIPVEYVMVKQPVGEEAPVYYRAVKRVIDEENRPSEGRGKTVYSCYYYFVETTLDELRGTGNQDHFRKEASFRMEGGNESTHEFAIYVGWDPTNESGEYRKEVDLMKIQVLVQSESGTVDVGEEYDDVNNPIPSVVVPGNHADNENNEEG